MPLTDDEKLRILETRAQLGLSGRKKSWDSVAAETHHRKQKVLEVNRWFQEMPREKVASFPEPIQRLRDDHIDCLKFDPISRSPATLLGQQASKACQAGDYSWMDDPKYLGHAFLAEPMFTPTEKGNSGMYRCRHTCQCGYQSLSCGILFH